MRSALAVGLCLCASLAAHGEQFSSLPRTNGEYVLSARVGGAWREIGRLGFDRFCRTRALEVRGLPAGVGVGMLKIEETGGGAAHIDCVRLDRAVPAEVEGAPRRKIIAVDRDLVDAKGQPIILSFRTPVRNGATIELTARIEPEVISKIPFQFPKGNTYKQISESSQFYGYELGSRHGSLVVDGDLARERLGRPFFAEFMPCASGHPDGITYGWVMDDGEKLYAAIDFTPDNTMDGDLDYAKVYAKTPAGVREFKVSVEDLDWGRPGFTYTDRVGYEHKVYEFEIPLAELLPGEPKGATARPSLQLAFAAYGTASAGWAGNTCAFDPVSRTYLVVRSQYMGATQKGDVFARLFDGDGNAVVAEFDIAVTTAGETYPCVAADTVNGGFLVLFAYQGAGNPLIQEQRVDSAGDLVGSVVDVSDDVVGAKEKPTVAFDSANEQFLVVWSDYRDNPDYQLRGRLVGSDGTVVGSNDFDAGGETFSSQSNPSLAFDPLNTRYLLVWTVVNVEGVFVDASGTPGGTIFSYASGGDYWDPDVACDAESGQFLVVWRNQTGGTDVEAVLVGTDGNAATGVMDVAATTDYEVEPSVAADPDRDRYLVVWNNSTDMQLEARFVSDTGAVDGASFVVTAAAGLGVSSVKLDPSRHCFGVGHLVNTNEPALTVTGRKAITASPTSGLTTTEAGDTATFDVVLELTPDADVTVAVESLDTTEGTVDPAALTFTTANWHQPQTVTVTGAEDAVDDEDVAYDVTLTPSSAVDTVYDAIAPITVALLNTDDDTAGITVTPTSGLTTTESGGTATFTIVLASEPTAEVSIGLSSSDDTEGTVSPTSVTFTTADWSTAKTLTATGVDDSVDDDDVAYTIETAPATSADAKYSGRDASDVSATNTDDDVASAGDDDDGCVPGAGGGGALAILMSAFLAWLAVRRRN